MPKKYTGSLSLDWFNKQKSILVQPEEAGHKNGDVLAPKVNWINKDEALFYEIVDDEGRGLSPYWVDRNDLRVKEARPLVFQRAYKAVEKAKAGSLIDQEIKLVESSKDDTAIENILIRGDNLLALNALKKLFENRPDEEKVKCIYIDPPYNTGSAFEEYDDNLAHSEWLTLTRDRLLVLWSLLSRGGSIWISVDDEESHYLKVVCDDLFGRQHFVTNVIWQKKVSPANDAKWFSGDHEHVLVYAKDKESWLPHRLPRTAEQLKYYNNPDGDPRGDWNSAAYTCAKTAEERPNLYYAITNNNTGEEIWPRKTRVWAFDYSTHLENEKKKLIYWGKDGKSSIPRIKKFLDNSRNVVPRSIWSFDEAGHTQEARLESLALFADNPFGTPKPEKLLHRILSLATQEGDLVLDCFGGSGTTFAVAQKMNRRWIGVEIGKHADTHIIPRLKKVLTGEDQSGISKAVNWKGGGSFKYYTLGESVIDRTTRDFNWNLGRDFIERSLLSSYDFGPDTAFSFLQGELITASHQPSIGFHRVGQKQMAGVVSLVEPKNEKPISYDELMGWYALLKKFKGTQSITIFTNRGVELAYDSKPEDLEVIKVPHAIFAELER